MKKLIFSKPNFTVALLWLCSFLTLLAQSPSTEQKEITYPNFVAPSYQSNIGTYTVYDVPSPRGEGIIGYVSDPNDYLDVVAEWRINELLYELEQKSSVEVAVVMLPSIGQEVPKDFAVKLFNTWKIGKADTDNGLLILTIMDQRRTEFEVGLGLEPILTDVVCYRIGINEIVPSFKREAYGQGIESAVLRIKEFLENPEAVDEIYGFSVVHDVLPFRAKWYHWVLIVYGLLCVIFGFWYFGRAFDIQRSKDDYYDKYLRLSKLKFGCTQILFPVPLLIFAIMAKKRLKKYRYAPRFSKINGQQLKIKDEWAENHYLEVAQILEEKLNSVRYDVWVTDDQSDIMILEYEGPDSRKYSDCKECGYKTYGKKKSYVSIAPTFYEEGERIDYFECRNCNYLTEEIVVIPVISNSSDSSSSSSSGSSFSSSSRSSSSSSSFGGGSSGGGGAGVSW